MASSTLAFLYQLQGTNYTKLANTDFKVAVIDNESAGLSSAQLNSLQTAGKNVIAYLSIGEAENYRSYWKADWNQNKPNFVLEQNENWEGNFRVKFWDKTWQDIVISKAVALAKAGYNGVTLDVVDVYTVGSVAASYNGRSDVRSEMMQFVGAISDAVKAINPNFKVIQNNAIDLLTVDKNNPNSASNTAHLAKIDGVNAESAFYGHDNLPVSWGKWDQQYLSHAVNAGKTVFSIDYATNEATQKAYIAEAIAKGFVPFVGNRELSTIDSTNYEIYSKLSGKILGQTVGEKTTDTTVPVSEVSPLTLTGTDKADKLNGAGAADKLHGQKGNDVLTGNAGNDYIEGNQGKDKLLGGAGDDTMHGGLDRDTLVGESGNDYLYGGTGNDVFFFNTNSGHDFVMDFQGAGKKLGDVIQISKSIYSSVAEVLEHVVYGSGNALIQLGGDNDITLANIVPHSLVASDFSLV